MSRHRFELGDILYVKFPEVDEESQPCNENAQENTRSIPSHDQKGKRPAVVVFVPDILGIQRFPRVTVAPITKFTEEKKWWISRAPSLYPILLKGAGGLKKDSVVLLNLIDSVDVPQVLQIWGRLTPAEYMPIRKAIAIMSRLRITYPLDK